MRLYVNICLWGVVRGVCQQYDIVLWCVNMCGSCCGCVQASDSRLLKKTKAQF